MIGLKQEYVVRIRPRAWIRAGLIAASLIVAVAAAGYAGRAAILTWIGAQLVHSDPLEPSDAILVLVGGTPEREIEAADLYRQGYAPLIVLTRESERPGVLLLKERGIQCPSELDERLRYLRELGVPADRVLVLDGIAKSTKHEAQVLKSWVTTSRVSSLLVVTSAFHTGRAKLTFDRAFRGLPIVLRYRPASLDSFRPETWWQDRVTLRNGLIEWQKQILYRFYLR